MEDLTGKNYVRAYTTHFEAVLKAELLCSKRNVGYYRDDYLGRLVNVSLPVKQINNK